MSEEHPPRSRSSRPNWFWVWGLFLSGLVAGLIFGVTASIHHTVALADDRNPAPLEMVPDEWRTDRPVVLEVYATWCPACKWFNPYFTAIEREVGNRAVFYKLDIDAPSSAKYLEKFKVHGTPTIIVFNRQGRQTYRSYENISPPEIRDAIWKTIGLSPPKYAGAA